MKKIAFELELFVTKGGKLYCPSLIDYRLPHDDSGMQLELRGEPSNNVAEAYYSVFVKLDEAKKYLSGYKVEKNLDWYEKSDLVLAMQQEYIRSNRILKKFAFQDNNLYSHSDIREKTKNFLSAGLHVHLSVDEKFYYGKKNKPLNRTHVIFDFPQDFIKIEKEFGADIVEAGRLRGFYEMKSHGGVEYRSLPSSLFFKSNFLERIKKCNLV